MGRRSRRWTSPGRRPATARRRGGPGCVPFRVAEESREPAPPPRRAPQACRPPSASPAAIAAGIAMKRPALARDGKLRHQPIRGGAIHAIIDRRRLPTSSIDARRHAAASRGSRRGWPGSPAPTPRANWPDWISLRIFFISAFVASLTTRGPRVVTVLGRIRDRVAHVREPALVEEVDDQLHLVHALEVGDLRLVSGLDERLVGGLDQMRDAAAERRLFAEQVGLRLFL